LDLVEVNANSTPPVCKILDYGKHKYEQAKKARENKKSKAAQELKEIKFGPRIGDHDFDFKVKHARDFLEAGHRVRMLVRFKGRQIAHPDTGRAVLDRACRDLADVCTVVQMVQMEGRQMSMVVGPKKNRQASEKAS
jgi:translation initiation factor IF-3